MMKLRIFFLIVAMNGVAYTINAQKAALKTNVLSDVFMNVNTGLDGLYHIIAGGNTGRYNLKYVTGFAIALLAILLELISTVDNII